VNKRQQSTLEYTIIISVVAIAGIIVAILYLHNTSSTPIGKQNVILNAEYFVSGNGQPICDPNNPIQDYYPQAGESCIVLVTKEPLPPWANYTQAQIASDPYICFKDKYIGLIRSKQYVFFSPNPPYRTKQVIYTTYDNVDDLIYLGKVDNYYEYMILAYGIKPLTNYFNLVGFELREFYPNIMSDNPPVNTSEILPLEDNLVVPVIVTNNTVGPIPVVGSYGEITLSVNNATITISGLPSGAQTTLNYQYSNTSTGQIVNAQNTITFSNSPYQITIPTMSGVLYRASVSGSVTYNGNIFSSNPSSIRYSAGENINFNYYKLFIGSLEYTLNKPLVNGAQVYFNLPNNTMYYAPNPYSNLVVTVGNTLNNGGTPVYVFVANYTSTSITLNIGNTNGAQTVYLNFVSPSDASYQNYISFSPAYAKTNPGMSSNPGPGIFTSYNPNIPSNWQPTPVDNTWNYITLVQNIQPNTAYIVGLGSMSLCSIDSIGFNNSQSAPLHDISDQAPYNGIYDFGSSCKLQFGQAYYSSPYEKSLTNNINWYGPAPITMAYNSAANTIVEEINGPDINGNIEESYSTTSEYYGDFVPQSFSAYQAFGNTGLILISYFAEDPIDILGYVSNYVGVVK
jgi:hypothetical protein